MANLTLGQSIYSARTVCKVHSVVVRRDGIGDNGNSLFVLLASSSPQVAWEGKRCEKPDQIIFDKETKESRPKNSHLLLREKNPGKRDRELSKQRWNFQTNQLLRFPLKRKF